MNMEMCLTWFTAAVLGLHQHTLFRTQRNYRMTVPTCWSEFGPRVLSIAGPFIGFANHRRIGNSHQGWQYDSIGWVTRLEAGMSPDDHERYINSNLTLYGYVKEI